MKVNLNSSKVFHQIKEFTSKVGRKVAGAQCVDRTIGHGRLLLPPHLSVAVAPRATRNVCRQETQALRLPSRKEAMCLLCARPWLRQEKDR